MKKDLLDLFHGLVLIFIVLSVVLIFIVGLIMLGADFCLKL